MKTNKNIIAKIFYKLFSDLQSAVTSILLGTFILGMGGIFIFAKNIWNAFLKILISPSPFWVVVVLAIIVFIYIFLIYFSLWE